MTEHSHSYPDIGALDCLEFMPLALLPVADATHDDGEHQVIDAETAYVFKIMGSRERAERIVATLNAAASIAARHSRPVAQASDIVERLRNFTVWSNRQAHYLPVPLCKKAADEIERLRRVAQAPAYPVSDYADLVKELHQSSDDYDRGHGPLHAAAANAIEHLSTLLTSHYTCRKAPECPHCGKIGDHDGACGVW